ncbi:MAG: chromosome segregation protein SMC [Gemmatimonadales bacterium]|nr:MAG: chromosome segregation protein SMC [Gemmatimonadales bacterium]
MRLKALRLHGFKSFADRTEVVFHDGITAIVGPNGCGKSNISDAIRWVLGEQRPTAIRGARMDEAIFQGTVSRRPVNRGSVSIEVTNEDGVLPVPFEEVEISRTVYRDGGSEYALNRSSCRLKDIQELCRDTGLGANAYSIIENRMIDAILSDRAEERRGLFEEAAGIGKYKDRRKGAVRRMERAELDLQRLEDLIGEVQTKVRSLARQKGRAERYGELRKRRLDLEVAIAQLALSDLTDRRREIRTLLDGGLDSGESLKAEIQTAEARLEAFRVERVRLEKARSEAARSLDDLRGELVRWERELAVAGERHAAAERRLGQIDGERVELASQAEGAAREREGLEDQERSARERLEALSERAEGVRARAGESREAVARARASLDEVEGRERAIARRVAQLMGDADAARERGRELKARVDALKVELERVDEELRELNNQGDLFTDRSRVMLEAEDAATEELQRARAEADRRRELVAEAREALRRAEDEAGSVVARVNALEKLERDQEGVEPVVRALLATGISGVHGVVADFFVAPPARASAVEAFLGGMARAVVVADLATAREIRRWFRESWKKGGGLIVLALDRVPGESTPDSLEGSLLEAVEPTGIGAPWVRALLGGARFAEGDELTEGGGVRVALDGTIVDRQGAIRLGNPLGSSGLVERKGRLRELRREAKAKGVAVEAAREEWTQREAGLEAAELAVAEARTALRSAEDAHREARAEAAAQSDRRGRLNREHEELQRRLDQARSGAEDAIRRAGEAREERDRLQSEEASLKEARIEARTALEAVQEGWEVARSEEQAVTVEEARLESEVSRLSDRATELERRAASARARSEALDREETSLREELEASVRVRSEGEKALEELFRKREEARALLTERDAAWSALEEEVLKAERRVRDARSSEREISDRRHRLELELGELDGRVGRIEERLEGEWGRPLESLIAEADEVEGSEEELKHEFHEVARTLERLGPVNMLAVEEHEEESARLDFLTEQRDDLVEARDDLRRAIREINQTATELFMETFELARENFRATFQRLFQGGECDLWLEDPDDPLESVIEIHASPRGKRTQRIDLLSGGERALTALSLLFGIYLVKPSPFCVLDEVDAPLDESNIGRFIRLLQEFKTDSQFVVITHNPRTIEAADWIYGVTMEEPGVSSIVGVRLEEALEAAGAPV